MSRNDRETILGKLRRAVGRTADDPAARAAVDQRIAARRRNTVPTRAQLDRAGIVDLFVEQAKALDASVTRVADADDVPAAVAAWLQSQNLPSRVRMAPDARLDAYPWGRVPLLEIARGKAQADDGVTVTGAFAAVAETGTLMLASGPRHPTTLNFLPDAHIVVLRADEVVGPYEDGWDRLREAGAMPRTVNFVTGPSRTGDIEQKLQLGAHGPRRLHIVLVAGGPPAKTAENG